MSGEMTWMKGERGIDSKRNQQNVGPELRAED